MLIQALIFLLDAVAMGLLRRELIDTLGFTAARAVALTGLELLEDAGKIEQAKAEWSEKVAKRGGPPRYE